MDIEVEEDERVSIIRLTDANEAVANSLRRTVLSKVPTLAVQHVDITVNESALFDEMLAHRIGQVPFTVPDRVEEEDTVHVAVQQEGPGKLRAEDIKTDDDGIEPVNPEAVIATLKEGQSVELEGEASLGRGREHAKHQGGTVGYEKVDNGEFLFRVESSSGYTNTELFEEAFEVLESELESFEEEVKEL
ncbi:MAG: hypothetical protein ABEJ03_02835 [Candidatus Nanohaloarchaea archaeon]